MPRNNLNKHDFINEITNEVKNVEINLGTRIAALTTMFSRLLIIKNDEDTPNNMKNDIQDVYDAGKVKLQTLIDSLI